MKSMCQTADEIARDDILVQEMDQFIKDNGLKDRESLMIRVGRANYIGSVQNTQDHDYIKKFMKKVEDTPSIPISLKETFWATFGQIVLVSFILFMAFYTFISITGYAEALKQIP